MKKLFILLIFFKILFAPAHAQYNWPPANPADSTPANCGWDLINNIFDSLSLFDSIPYGNGTNSDYHDVSFTSDGKDAHHNACATDGCTGIADSVQYHNTLKIYVHYPKFHNYNYVNGNKNGKLPAFFFVHGGSFSDCSGISAEKDLPDLMAHRGFICLNIEYRRGRKLDSLPSLGYYTSVYQLAAVYRAAEEIRGAIRYVMYREKYHDSLFSGDLWRIDTNNIFLGGNSAGALTALTAAYYYETSGQDKVNKVYPIPGTKTIDSVMGSINANYYKGDSSYNYMQHVKGILSDWGAVYIPKNKISNPKSFFSDLPYKPPVIAFQGRLDRTFPPDTSKIFFSPTGLLHNEYNSTSSCIVRGTYNLDATDTTVDEYEMGMKGFYDSVLIPLQIECEFYFDCQMQHGLDDDCDNCTFQSEFGTGLNT